MKVADIKLCIVRGAKVIVLNAMDYNDIMKYARYMRGMETSIERLKKGLMYTEDSAQIMVNRGAVYGTVIIGFDSSWRGPKGIPLEDPEIKADLLDKLKSSSCFEKEEAIDELDFLILSLPLE